jgi:hypothetical protein
VASGAFEVAASSLGGSRELKVRCGDRLPQSKQTTSDYQRFCKRTATDTGKLPLLQTSYSVPLGMTVRDYRRAESATTIH